MVGGTFIKVSLCEMAAVPGAQLDLSWVMPQSSTTDPPAPLIPCGSRNCPDAASLYSQILMWLSVNSTGIRVGEVVNIQSISGCVSDIRVQVSVDYDCNITTFV
jgi:hypothetical protein